MIPLLVYIAIGILFMFWLNNLINADSDLERPGDRDFIRISAILLWFPVLLIFTYTKIKESKKCRLT